LDILVGFIDFFDVSLELIDNPTKLLLLQRTVATGMVQEIAVFCNRQNDSIQNRLHRTAHFFMPEFQNSPLARSSGFTSHWLTALEAKAETTSRVFFTSVGASNIFARHCSDYVCK
jgi:hypothetical protein